MIEQIPVPSDPRTQLARPGRFVLWWGRSDPEYARNRIMRRCLVEAGFRIVDFRPSISAAGDVEARLRVRSPVDLVWVPCFRQRDLAAARRWSARRQIPLIFDPLISAFDKQVFEREKFGPDSLRARRLLAWERRLFACPHQVLADTRAHAEFFREMLGVGEERVSVVPLCADESLFVPLETRRTPGQPLEVLFFGSFIPLQGPEVIIEAANRYQGPPVRWRLVGHGPLRSTCESLARKGSNVEFEDWIPYRALPARIAQADIVLGIFGNTPKAARVVPNKFCQALACGRPLVTRETPAIPDALERAGKTGLFLVPPADPQALAERVKILASAAGDLPEHGKRALRTYQRHFSSERVAAALNSVLRALSVTTVAR